MRWWKLVLEPPIIQPLALSYATELSALVHCVITVYNLNERKRPCCRLSTSGRIILKWTLSVRIHIIIRLKIDHIQKAMLNCIRKRIFGERDNYYFVRVCVCVCVWERERGRDRVRKWRRNYIDKCFHENIPLTKVYLTAIYSIN
jgi:hypothetical protein